MFHFDKKKILNESQQNDIRFRFRLIYYAHYYNKNILKIQRFSFNKIDISLEHMILFLFVVFIMQFVHAFRTGYLFQLMLLGCKPDHQVDYPVFLHLMG